MSHVYSNPAGTPGAKVDLSRLDAPAAPSYRVCIKAHETHVGNTVPVGHVVTLEPHELPQQPACWIPCDKGGWVSNGGSVIPGVSAEFRGSRDAGANPTDWRPVSTPKPSALDEMAEQAARWAAPTRECAVPGYTGPFRYEETVPKPSALDEMAEQVRRWAVPTRDQAERAYAEGGLIDPSRVRHAEPDWPEAFVPFEAMFKPTNPKDAAATGRVPLGLLSPIAKAHWALAQHCGRAKYGAWNWREAGARASIYLDAIGRHADGYLSGETYDPADLTHHLGNIMACCAILLEAEAAGKLVDDRPPHLDMRPTYADVERRQANLTAKYADRNPKHWTR